MILYNKEGKGRDKMCSIVEEYATKRAEEARREAEEARREAEEAKREAEKAKREAAEASAKTARASANTARELIKAGVSDEIIKNATGLTQEEIEKLHLEINA